MLLPRIIPVLLIQNSGLVKTTHFKNPIYLGDPLNAVRIFNDKEVDEIMILDIDASVKLNEPNYDLISKISRECMMPICYGGGISSAKQVEKIVSLGVEKVAISSKIIENTELISDTISIVGSQSVVAVIDIKMNVFFSTKYNIYTKNGLEKKKIDLVKFIEDIQGRGIGEIVINTIHKDGTLLGYDHNLLDLICPHIKVPMTIIGGASSLNDISNLFKKYGIIGAGVGSLFLLKGKFKAPLIQYPTSLEKKNLLEFNS